MAIEVKIFLGFLVTSEIKANLKYSSSWKQAILDTTCELKDIEKNQRHYIGKFIPQELTLKELKNEEEIIKKNLQLYCPKINLDQHRCYFFSQLFIS
ncbi:MAG: hypothetical protein Q8K60_00540 [Parachlamydiaceae bacterium]|nr:hypothetical protein [Parachlamydiaceae bacterium]